MPDKRSSGVSDRLARTADDVFGWSALRPGQRTAMEAVMRGRDTLAVMPTGAGKSAVYQVPGLLLPGPTVVVSPLIALQRDQIAGLLRHDDAPDAVAVNSAQAAGEADAAWDAVRHGDAEFLFLSPEQLAKDEVVERLARAAPSLFVVDEAQCVAAWGHDFRPDYLRLAQAAQRVGRPTVLALTATAAPPVREEIVERLGMDDPALVVAGFDRPNIALEVRRFLDDADKRRGVVERAAAEPKPGIVYTATRRDAEAYADDLATLGLSAAAYHAGLAAGERSRVHDAFLAGETDVVVATSAFGMGIDKEDVRFVLHASVPGSLDAYYQEIGRAGRDGGPALAVLHYRPQDSGLQRLFATRAPDEETLGAVAERIHERDAPMEPDDIRKETDLSRRRVTAAVNLLEQAGAVHTEDDGRVRAVPGTTAQDAAARAAEVARSRTRLEQSRLAMMLGYAETTGCRRRFLLGYFGEPYDAPCGACDVCTSPSSGDTVVEGVGDTSDESDLQAPAVSYPTGMRVRHTEWGEGTVMSEEGDRITVLFESMGYRTLSLPAIAGTGLLTAAPLSAAPPPATS
ncbi:RecQ family ATP-dependent DNA helicase [Streptomyces doebereineriae]|uniref:ATP-dependent DNA helicase RecQ n=1 Tax=Streptomyces doebereineriae TaxID=3075528 RepID=A0ABU2VEY0_9ACTN|nr:RecQ family ATP-dependent DNA helicase [Streptomyces sp. DSM 41640]MDT0484121.1 RecQ family ATP-dependent DNA helicase [Streptomyces sp. DSM 41640]